MQLCGCYYCFSLALLITGSHIVLISMFGRLRRFLWPSICADSLSLWIFQWCSCLWSQPGPTEGGDLPSLSICGQPHLIFPLPHPLNMARGTRTVYPGKWNKGLNSTFQPPEEGWSEQWPRHGDKDEDNSLKNVNDVHNTSSQKYRLFP